MGGGKRTQLIGGEDDPGLKHLSREGDPGSEPKHLKLARWLRFNPKHLSRADGANPKHLERGKRLRFSSKHLNQGEMMRFFLKFLKTEFVEKTLPKPPFNRSFSALCKLRFSEILAKAAF